MVLTVQQHRCYLFVSIDIYNDRPPRKFAFINLSLVELPTSIAYLRQDISSSLDSCCSGTMFRCGISARCFIRTLTGRSSDVVGQHSCLYLLLISVAMWLSCGGFCWPLSFCLQPIPYWLYKLHGLNINYNCEICGNYTYRGPKAFQRHFAVCSCCWWFLNALEIPWTCIRSCQLTCVSWCPSGMEARPRDEVSRNPQHCSLR